ncbi:Hpt domain-containing protein [Pseudarthrobacter sp. NamE2]|uniref:Hpt domain-containing protein n=1 Tax=Pseudarthrobacter sp. NamE2 TaxID=2576838 RepID=UPI0010FD3385|nr:Hpt domain-containing protein [Pseudarthrobacter sp. NamE2]TLM81718.1 Hpt domain-containing protein [Pseudarthrobacter sp. NamE2]
MQDNGQPRPLLDPSVLERLRDGLDDDDDIWRVFVQNYIDELPLRIERIRHTLTTGDLPGAIDAALSLKSSSQMVGAERLAGNAFDLEQALRQDPATSDPGTALPLLAAAYLRRIRQCSKQTTYALRALL